MIYQCEMWFAIRRMLDTSCRRCTFLQNWLCTESAVCSRPSSVKITNVRSCKPCFFRSFSNAGFCIVCVFLGRKCNQHSLYLFWGEAVEKCNQYLSGEKMQPSKKSLLRPGSGKMQPVSFQSRNQLCPLLDVTCTSCWKQKKEGKNTLKKLWEIKT